MSPEIFADPVLAWLGPVPITRTDPWLMTKSDSPG